MLNIEKEARLTQRQSVEYKYTPHLSGSRLSVKGGIIKYQPMPIFVGRPGDENKTTYVTRFGTICLKRADKNLSDFL